MTVAVAVAVTMVMAVVVAVVVTVVVAVVVAVIMTVAVMTMVRESHRLASDAEGAEVQGGRHQKTSALEDGFHNLS